MDNMLILKTLIKYLFNTREVDSVMINLFVMQVQLGWLEVEDIPEPYRSQVEELLALSNTGLKE